MKSWVDSIQKELGLNVTIDVDSILDVARDAAHAVERPAAPVTTYLLGIAVANGHDLHEACDKIAALAKAWPKSE
ncbi:MAG: molybdopterin-guanine dinucleotide biosynthesis protein [Actinobacteria bacterium]|nr:molybdopterin-guanine dinucleotide biosynthesis protein [Actinomycetota bacterium]